MKPIIGFAGMGHLGTHSAEAARAKGFTVSSIIKDCDIVYISPDRPGDISPQETVDMVLRHLRDDAVLVVLCQVEPGFTRKIQWPQVYYQVETLRMKDAKERALNPDRIIIGCRDKMNIGYLVNERLVQFLDAFNCPLITMSYESAELAKIAINIYLAAQVSATNTLSEIAEKVGADWEEIIPALQSDARIGKEAYLQPGYGLSEHLERDLKTVKTIENVNVDVTNAFLRHSQYRRKKSQN